MALKAEFPGKPNHHFKVDYDITVFDRIELINTRFHLIKKSCETDYLNRKIELLKHDGSAEELMRLENQFKSNLKILSEEEHHKDMQ